MKKPKRKIYPEPSRRIILKGTPTFENFSVLKKVPYRTFLELPERITGIPMFYSIYFNLKPLKIKKFVNLFLSSPKRYEKIGITGARSWTKDFKRGEELYKNFWLKLNKKEKISFNFALLHTFFVSCREKVIHEILIDCPPTGFNIESFVAGKKKLKLLEAIKERLTKECEEADRAAYPFLENRMKEMRKIFLHNKKIVKKKYQEEIERIFKFRNFYEMIQKSLLQLLYQHPGIFRFKEPIPTMFLEQIKYYDLTPKKYFIFPPEGRKLGGSLRGLGASPGKIKGKAGVYVDVKEAFKSLKNYQILVCPKTNPSWVPVLSKVSGVITESGGLLSHAAIVSRELKIPCIVNVEGATKKLKDGDLIEIDGETGEIKLLEK
jgi:phosphohistidine swiveling domain-containing protein